VYIKKKKTSQINNLIMHLKCLEKQEQTKPQTSRWREIMKIRPRSMRLSPEQLYKESIIYKVFFEKINKIDKTLANKTK
jgi:hypothetical protein